MSTHPIRQPMLLPPSVMQECWKRHVSFLDARNIDGLMSTFTADAEIEIVNSPYRWKSHEELRHFYRELFRAIPSADFKTETAAFSEVGVFEKSVLTGAHDGFFRDYAPSLRVIETTLASFLYWDASQNLFSKKELYVDLGDLFCGMSRSGSNSL